MKDFQYSNLNVPKMNEFLKKDTKNYKDLKGSLCGKAYDLEEKISQANSELDIINCQIEAENENYERKLNELKNGKENEKAGFFSKLGKKLKNSNELKDLEKKHNQAIMVLEDKLKKQSKIIEEFRMRLQAIIFKLEEKGIIWEEMRKYLEERIRLGVFANQNTEDKSKLKKPDMKDYEKMNWEEMKRRARKEAIAEMGESYERNAKKETINEKDKLDLSKLTPYEREQILKMYRHMKYNDGLSFDRVAARGFRLSLFDDDRLGRMAKMSNNFSDYALYKNVYNPLFGNGGRGLRDLRSMIDRERRGLPSILSPNLNAPKTVLGWVDNTIKNIMKDSGYGLNYIKSNTKQTSEIFKDTLMNKFDSLERAGNFTQHYCDFMNMKDKFSERSEFGEMMGDKFSRGSYLDDFAGRHELVDSFLKEGGKLDFGSNLTNNERNSFDYKSGAEQFLSFDKNSFSGNVRGTDGLNFEGNTFAHNGLSNENGTAFIQGGGLSNENGTAFIQGGGLSNENGNFFGKGDLSFGNNFGKMDLSFGDNMKNMEERIGKLEESLTRSVLKDGMERGREIEKMETSALEQQRQLTFEKSGPK